MAQFKADQTSGINGLLGLIYVLLLLAVVIALLGIVNTLGPVHLRAHPRARAACAPWA